MKKNLIQFSVIFSFIMIMLGTSCFAATDEFRAFNTWDFDNTTAVETLSYAVWTFQNLGYTNSAGTNKFNTTSSRDVVLNYIKGSGRNYGFYIKAHGNPNLFTTKSGDSSQYIYPDDISGNWHLVFIDSCSTGASDNFARKFNTVGYSNRAYLSWYKTVTVGASREWWGYFYQYAGNSGLRSACLAAADRCSNSTPIRMYGDKEWNGKAW